MLPYWVQINLMVVFFDIDATLIDHKKAADVAASHFLKNFSDILPYSETDFCNLWHKLIEKHSNMFFAGEVSFLEQRRNRMRELFHLEPTLSEEEADRRYQIYLDSYESNWTLFEDVISCLDSLTSKTLGIISNGNLIQQHKKLKQSGIINRFQTIVISEEVGFSKPKPEIFLEACRLAKTSPGNCIYIGDRLDIDALACQVVGMKGIWLNRTNLPIADSSVSVINSLTKLNII
jgi:putative hydrolase of the HAD superfamily